MIRNNIDIFDGFCRGKKVLVTGHTGFKGSWLCIWLHELGAEVVGVGLEPYSEKDNFVLSGIGKKIQQDIRADIRDGERMKQMKKYLDFGISTEQAGSVFNLGLASQKEGFGGRTVVYDMYKLMI